MMGGVVRIEKQIRFFLEAGGMPSKSLQSSEFLII
jgi:hypothetical protein